MINVRLNLYGCQNNINGFNLIASGNCALVTRKLEIPFPCNSATNLLISGYIIGSPVKFHLSIIMWDRICALSN